MLLLRIFRRLDEMWRQEVKTPNEFEGHVISGALLGQSAEEIDQDVEVGIELFGGAGQVLRGEHPRGHCRDLEVVGPTQEVLETRHPGAVGVGVAGQPLGTRIATVAVEHHTDVLGETVAVEPADEVALVDAIEETESHIRCGHGTPAPSDGG